MLWLSNDDPVKLKELERLPLMEYWFQLTKKIADIKKANSNKPGQKK